MKRAWSPTAPGGPYDVIVIGAGIGGLSAAGLLAQLGRKVLVLEQHTVPGGLTQSFRRAQWSWDVGLHLVGEMGATGLAGRILGALSGDRLEWNRIDGAYDAAELPDGRTVEFHANLVNGLTRAFPDRALEVARYGRALHDGAAAMRDHFVGRSLMPLGRTSARSRELALTRTADVLDSVTDDPALRATMGLHWVFYGTPPDRSAFGVHALLARHYRHGAYYPVGGAMSLARTLSTELAAHGGWVRTQADVERIEVEHGRVTGVRLTSGETLRVSTVVSAAGALNTARLVPSEEWTRSIEALAPSCPHVCLHLGFDGDLRAAGASATNRWLISDLREGPWDTVSPRPCTYVAFPSLKDPSQAPNAEVVAFCDWAPFAAFAGTRWRDRGAEYEALKARITRTLLDLLLERMPKLKGLIQHAELSTPLSTAHFARGAHGAAYGLDSTPERFANRALKPRTPIKGLHLAGTDVAMVGVGGALVGGLAAAVSLEPERAGVWLHRAVRHSRSRRKVA